MKDIASRIIIGLFIGLMVVYLPDIYNTKTYEGKFKINVVNNDSITGSYQTTEYDKLNNEYKFIDENTGQKLKIYGNNIKILDVK